MAKRAHITPELQALHDAQQAYMKADLDNSWDAYEEAVCRYALAANKSVPDAYEIVEHGEIVTI